MGRVAMPDEVSAGTALNLKRESLDRDYYNSYNIYIKINNKIQNSKFGY